MTEVLDVSLLDVSLAGISTALICGSTSSEVLVRGYLSKIDRLNPHLNSFVCVADGAINAARASDQRRQAGRALGPLDGVPIAIKDLFNVAGLPTGGGSNSQPVTPCHASAEVVSRLESAGMIVLGKTASVELGCGGWGTQSATPTPWNPWDAREHRVPGGSSSGSAVAVSAGLAPVALGTDTGGSVRIPAAFCGIVGFKPSTGILPVAGILPFCPSHDTVGILAQNVADTILLFNAMIEAKERAQFLVGRSSGRIERTGLPARIGFLANEELDSCSSDVAALYRSCTEKLRDVGHHVLSIVLPRSFETYTALAGELALNEAFTIYGERISSEPEKFGSVVRKRILSGRSFGRWSALLAKRNEAHLEFAASFSDFDFIVTPTCPAGAIRLAEVDEDKVPTLFTRFANYLDLPAISIPLGFDRSGLPVGLQLMAARNRDDDLLAFADLVETALDVKHNRPNTSGLG